AAADADDLDAGAGRALFLESQPEAPGFVHVIARVIGHALTPVRRGIDARLEEFPEQPAQSAGDAYQCARSDRSARGFSNRVAIAVEPQPDAGGERRAVDVIRQPADVARTAAPDREIENLLGDLRHPVEDRAAAGQHDAGVEALLVAGAA